MSDAEAQTNRPSNQRNVVRKQPRPSLDWHAREVRVVRLRCRQRRRDATRRERDADARRSCSSLQWLSARPLLRSARPRRLPVFMQFFIASWWVAGGRQTEGEASINQWSLQQLRWDKTARAAAE